MPLVLNDNELYIRCQRGAVVNLFENILDVYGTFDFADEVTKAQYFNDMNKAEAFHVLPYKFTILLNLVSSLVRIYLIANSVTYKSNIQPGPNGIFTTRTNLLRIQPSHPRGNDNNDYLVNIVTPRTILENWARYGDIIQIRNEMKDFQEQTRLQKTIYLQKFFNYFPQWIDDIIWEIKVVDIASFTEVKRLLEVLMGIPVRFHINFAEALSNDVIAKTLEHLFNDLHNVKHLSGFQNLIHTFKFLRIDLQSKEVLAGLLRSNLKFVTLHIDRIREPVSIACRVSTLIIENESLVSQYPSEVHVIMFKNVRNVHNLQFPPSVHTLKFENCSPTARFTSSIARALNSDNIRKGQIKNFSYRSVSNAPRNASYVRAIRKLQLALQKKEVRSIKISPTY